MRLPAKLAGTSLALAYGTYILLALPGIRQSLKWYIFGVHMLLIGVTLLIALFGAFRGSRFCIFAILADAPLVYAQYLS
jgi:hypothetical protein